NKKLALYRASFFKVGGQTELTAMPWSNQRKRIKRIHLQLSIDRACEANMNHQKFYCILSS
ncbi:MAG: hypothetical protein ACRC9S_02855, partial [Vibrio sp.]